jgi:subtilisin-like proprotein convertase family protein
VKYGLVNAAASVGAAETSATAPIIINAVNMGTANSLGQTIRVTFDRAMNAATFTPADVLLTGPDGKPVAVSAVKAVAGYSNQVFDIVLASAQTAPGTYALKVGPAVNDNSGTAMTQFYKVFTVSAPAVPPKVVNAVILGGSTTSIATIRLSFDRAMNPATFSPADVVLTGPDGKVIAVSTVTPVAGYGNNVFDIKLAATQTRGGNYTLKVGPAVNDTNGLAMTVFQKVFTLTTPVSAPVIVNVVNQGSATSLGPVIRISFDRAINASTFTTGNVVLTGPAGNSISVIAVTAVAGYSNQVFDIILSAAQTMPGTYTLKVGPAVSDTFGVQMAAAFTKTLAVAAPATPPAIVNAVNLGNSSTSMSTIRVSFSRAMNAATFTPADVTLIGPDGKLVTISAVTAVAGYPDTVFDIKLTTTQTKGGTYTLKVGPSITDTFGVSMAAVFQKAFTLAGTTPTPTPTPSAGTYTASSSVNVPKGGIGVSLLTVSNSYVIGSLTVKVNITHPEDRDLYIHLQAPDGTDILLSNQKGGFSANFANTVFDDSAAKPVSQGFGPFTGSYRPDVPLSYLNGKNVQGAWKLWVEDRVGVSAGTILNWSLSVKPKATM